MSCDNNEKAAGTVNNLIGFGQMQTARLPGVMVDDPFWSPEHPQGNDSQLLLFPKASSQFKGGFILLENKESIETSRSF